MEYESWNFGQSILKRERPVRIDDNERYASVLIPIIRMAIGEPGVLYEVRSNGIFQGGDISFPGGGREAGESALDAAVREACEELLVEKEQVKIVSPLNEAEGPGGRIITSFLGTLENYKGTFATDEVEKIFAVPVSWFMNHPPVIGHANLRPELDKDFPVDLIPGGGNYHWHAARKDYYFYKTPDGMIWGLTAKLTYYFLRDYYRWFT